MSLTADQAKLELNKLIDNSKIQYFNNFVTLPNDTKSYWYNKGYELSKKMFKLCSLYYIQDMSKRLNKKTTIIPFKSIDIEKEDGYVKRKLKFALDSGEAKTDKIQFGNQKGLRDVVTIDGKHFPYNPKKIQKY